MKNFPKEWGELTGTTSGKRKKAVGDGQFHMGRASEGTIFHSHATHTGLLEGMMRCELNEYSYNAIQWG